VVQPCTGSAAYLTFEETSARHITTGDPKSDTISGPYKIYLHAITYPRLEYAKKLPVLSDFFNLISDLSVIEARH